MIIKLGIEENFKNVIDFLNEFKKEELQANRLIPSYDELLKLMPKFLGTSLVAYEDDELIGVLAGLIFNHPFKNEKIWQEVFWYIKPEYRKYSKAMLSELEKFCLSLGIRLIVMAHFGCKKREQLDRFYKIHGFEYLETHFIKNL